MRCFVLLASLLAVPCSVVASDRHCLGPGDINADHLVDLTDHSLFADCVAGPAPQPELLCLFEHRDSFDFDHDGDVDLADVALFAQKFDNIYFDYGAHREDKEAEHLALKLTDALRAPDVEYERIHRDLALMREEYTELLEVFDSGQPPDNGLFVRLFTNDDRDEFDALNEFYLFTWDEQYTIVEGLHYLEFCDVLNPYPLGGIYAALSEVKYAYSNGVGCIPPCCWTRIVVERFLDVFSYDFSFYYAPPTDPENICACWRNRVIETDNAGKVVQVSCEDGCLPECP